VPERGREQTAERAGDEQVAVAHHGRAEHLALQARQPGGWVRGVQRVVGSPQQVGDHERGVHDRHRDDPRGQPAGRRHRGQERAERHAAQTREHERRRLARQAAAVGPGEREQRRRQQRQRGS